MRWQDNRPEHFFAMIRDRVYYDFLRSMRLLIALQHPSANGTFNGMTFSELLKAAWIQRIQDLLTFEWE